MRTVIQCRTHGAALSLSLDPTLAQTSILHLISHSSSHTPTIIHLFIHLVSQSCVPDKHGFTCGVFGSFNFRVIAQLCVRHVCTDVRLHFPSCVFFLSSFFQFSFSVLICTSFAQHVCTMCLHLRHHRIFLYLCFMLSDLHTYISHYAPLRSWAICRLVRTSHPNTPTCAILPVIAVAVGFARVGPQLQLFENCLKQPFHRTGPVAGNLNPHKPLQR